jgi:hypothetical protein
MEETGDKSVNEEVYRLLQEEVSPDKQDSFFRGVIAHIKSASDPTVREVREFFYKIWKGAEAHEKEAKRQLGTDY